MPLGTAGGHLLARRRRVHEELRAGPGARRADHGERRGRLLRAARSVLRGPGEELRDRLLLVAAVRLVHRAQGLGVPAREHVRSSVRKLDIFACCFALRWSVLLAAGSTLGQSALGSETERRGAVIDATLRVERA